jgi:hypothetical protein
MTKDRDYAQEGIDQALAQLRAQAGEGGQAAAQIFLHDDTPASDLPDVAKKIVSAAKQKVGKTATAELGKVHQLAKSFSLRADVDTLTAVANMPDVKTILPSEITDIFPRPVKVTPV